MTSQLDAMYGTPVPRYRESNLHLDHRWSNHDDVHRSHAKALLRLSNRERQVLDLIVAHHTDREIAQALLVSYRTVTTHVQHIFNKLGVNSRRDAEAIARQFGLDA